MVGAIAILVVALVLIIMSTKKARKKRYVTADGKLQPYNWPARARIGGMKNFSELKDLESAINDSPVMWVRLDWDEQTAYLMFREQDPAKQEAELRAAVEGMGLTVEEFLDMDALERELDLKMTDENGNRLVVSPTALAEAERKAREKGDPLARWKR